MTASPVASKIGRDKKCDICDATFSRQEHLLRHTRSHTREKPFKCLICGKGFARQDVLNRHHTSHEQDRRETSAVMRSRACRQCATSRARCSRSDPCKRCTERNLTCTFPTTRKSKAIAIVSTGMEIDSEPQYTGLDAIHQTIERQAVDETLLLTTGSGAPGNMNGAGLNDVHLASRTDAWIQQPAMFEVSQAIGPTEHGAQPIYELSAISGFNEQAMDLLSMNWMSPENSTSIGWDGLIGMPPYAENDKSDPYMPFFFPTSGALPGSDRECVPRNNAQTPSIGRHDANTDRTDDSTNKLGSERSKAVTGSYYVDGNGSRAPFCGRAARQWRGRQMMAANDASTLGSNGTNCTDGGTNGVREDLLVDSNSYSNMIRQLHLGLGRKNVPMDANSFPSLQCIAICVQSYFAIFHSTFPFIRKTTFLEESVEDWILLLAVAVVGSKYTACNEERLLSSEFIAILDGMSISRICQDRRTETGIPSRSPFREWENSALSLSALQAASLSLICSLHGGKQDMTKRALIERHCLVGACKELNLLSREFEGSHHHHDGNNVIQGWLRNQCRMRTGLMIWILDAMISYEFNVAPLMQFVDIKVPLPCSDHIWENPSVEKVVAEQKSSATLLDVIERLYIEKRLPENLGEFSNILIIHGIWRRSKEVINQSQTRLANWVPSATIQAREAHQSAVTETWPPSSPTLSKWRNSACDCLDILHWRANGKAASAGGLEHPTILYLHLSRLILLTPVAQIQTLATSANNANATNLAISQRYAEASSCVLKWAMNDSFKARLAIIHAGALFWHIRRYSRRSFLEPFTIYISTLIIWAYSISVKFAKQQEELQMAASMEGPPSPEACAVPTACQQSTTPKDEELCSEVSFFYIDRPCDDEMVQMYLRYGDKLSAHMARVGTITQASAPSRILQEGIRLLANDTTGGTLVLATGSGGQDRPKISTWGAEQTYMDVLAALSQTMEQRQT
ncbi:fungal-specific transcription factor domain-containing protein [Trichoderma evansii]